MAATADLTVEVQAQLVLDVPEPARLALHVATGRSVRTVDESFEVDGPGARVDVVDVGGSRAHAVQTEPGLLTVTYRATALAGAVVPVPVEPADRLVALRQSRYCPADLVEGLADTELGHLRGKVTAGRDVGAWVHGRLAYEVGSTGPSETGIDTLLHGHGVCRDFAHVTVMLCRALGIPARFVAVYAPGLSPMDFHAVAEVAGPDGWEIVDATRLAPRPSLVRIATGRDAADTALVTTLEGHADLVEAEVMAVTTGELPTDDHAGPVSIA